MRGPPVSPLVPEPQPPMTTTTKPLQIGPLQLDFPVVQAALSGYSDTAMRVIARRLGASYALCEVMLDKFILQVRDRRKNHHFMHVDPDEHPSRSRTIRPRSPAACRTRL